MIRSASGYGRGRRRTALTMLKMAVFAPIPSPSVMIATAENAGFLINCRKARRRLLITKRDHRIDPGCATRRDETGGGRDRGQQSRDCEINRRVERINFEKNIFQSRGCDDSEEQRDAARAKNKPDGKLPGALRHDHAEDSARVGAQCHANAEFLRALVHRKTHDAVKTDRGKNECNDSEDREQRRDEAIAGENFIVKSSRRSAKISRKIRIEPGKTSSARP